jgi:hypothetical protein
MPQPDSTQVTDKNTRLSLLDYVLRGVIRNIQREDIEPNGYSREQDKN